jgi:hypothetical protein
MPIQFSGTLEAHQYQEWYTWGWLPDVVVQWTVRPSPGQVGSVSLRALATDTADDGTLTYRLTVWNVGDQNVSFDAIYTEATQYDLVIYDGHGPYALAAGATINLAWDLGNPAAPVEFVAIPIGDRAKKEQFSGSFQCSNPSVAHNSDGSVTYYFSVTNTGSDDGEFRLVAGVK